MTLIECYEAMHGDYQAAKGRLMSDRLIEKFVRKFPQDPTFDQLKQALAAEDYEVAFRAAHTLKGVAANLSFTALQAAASELTERLRNDKSKPDDGLVQKVEEEYKRIIEALRSYTDGQ